MEFNGVSRKKGVIIIIGFIVLVTLINYLISNQASMIISALGMIVSGAIGLKLNSYAFISREAMNVKNSKKFESFVLFMNFFLIFFGVVITYNQFF